MSYKRIKNKKIEPSHNYPIRHIKYLDKEKIQPYTQSAINTGMEEDEKEEHDLKSALINKGSIPIPKIEQTNLIKNYGMFKKPKEYVKHSEDVLNDYVLCDEDEDMCRKLCMTEDEMKNKMKEIREMNEKHVKVEAEKKNEVDVRKSIGFKKNTGDKKAELEEQIEEDKKAEDIKKKSIDEQIEDYLQERTLLLYDDDVYNSYACFRKRIIKLGRKSRKLDLNCTEKLKRMTAEILLLEKLYELSIYKFEAEKEKFYVQRTMVNKALTDDNRKRRIRLSQDILGRKRKIKEDVLWRKQSCQELMNNRKLINSFKIEMRDAKFDDKILNSEIEMMHKLKKVKLPKHYRLI